MEVDDDTPQVTGYRSSNANIMTQPTINSIDVSNYPTKKKKRSSNAYDKSLSKDNKLLTDFINKCILLDTTEGMEAVINKVLLPAYVQANSEYKTSKKFEKVITKALQRLINNPERKYTHISDIVQTLKFHAAPVPVSTCATVINDSTSSKPYDSTSHIAKNVSKISTSKSVLTSPKSTSASTSTKSSAPPINKRVNLITLSTKVSVKPNEYGRKRTIIDITDRVSPKKSKPEVVAPDDDDDDVIPIDDKVNDEELRNNGNMINGTFKYNDEIENPVNETIEIQDSQELTIIDDAQSEEKENKQLTRKSNSVPRNGHRNIQINNEPNINEADNGKENLGFNHNMSDPNELLVPLLVPVKEKIISLEKPKKKKQPIKMPGEMTEDEKARRINEIKAKIKKCHRTIARLDLEEVTDDSANSPYYKCDRLRATIVKLYKELCTLEGEDPPERPKIKLIAKEGVPPGPMRRFERFLNEQIDEDGEPLIPDLRDALKCVETANVEDKLGWSKEKVMAEAQEMCEYTVRILQNRRQKREEKHVIAIAGGRENYDADPAKRDRELKAKLEENSRIGRKRMAEVISKFTTLQDKSKLKESTGHGILDENSSSEPEPTDATILKEDNNLQNLNMPENNSTDNTINDNINNNVSNDNSSETVVIKQELEVPIQKDYRRGVSLIIEISDSESEDEYGVLAF